VGLKYGTDIDLLVLRIPRIVNPAARTRGPGPAGITDPEFPEFRRFSILVFPEF